MTCARCEAIVQERDALHQEVYALKAEHAHLLAQLTELSQRLGTQLTR